jgi:hypothetical protein
MNVIYKKAHGAGSTTRSFVRLCSFVSSVGFASGCSEQKHLGNLQIEIV